jgi:hypothetical protein
MARSETTIISLEEAGRRFEEWRHNRSGKGRIPAKLCSVAVEVAGKEGLNRTARELHVAWDDLEAAGGDLGRGSAATGFAGVCGTGRTAGAIEPMYWNGRRRSVSKCVGARP